MREPGKIGLGVVRLVDLVLGVEETWHIDVSADVLDHDIGCLAPSVADWNVAVGHHEAFEIARVGAAHDLDARSGGVGQAREVDGIRPREICPDCLEGSGQTNAGAVGKARPERRSLAIVDPECRRGFRAQPQEVLGNRVEKRDRLRFCRGACSLGEGRA